VSRHDKGFGWLRRKKRMWIEIDVSKKSGLEPRGQSVLVVKRKEMEWSGQGRKQGNLEGTYFRYDNMIRPGGPCTGAIVQ
jgi:hypothetical protein